MKIIILTVLLLSLENVSYGQQSEWTSATNWIVYNVPEGKIWHLSIDSLKNFNRKVLNTDSLQALLLGTDSIIVQYSPAWMGAYLATCTLDHVTRKVIISTYGGFFCDQISGKYFQVPLSVQKDWLNYWAASVASLQASQ